MKKFIKDSETSSLHLSKKKKIIIAIAIFILGISLGLFTALMMRSTFLTGSSINGIDVSKMTSKEASKKITSYWSKKSLKVKEKDKAIDTIPYSSLHFDIDKKVDKALSASPITKIKRFFVKDDRKMNINFVPDKKTNKFLDDIDKSSIVKNVSGTIRTQNAYVSLKNRNFNIIPAVFGNNIDRKKFENSIFDAISKGKDTFKYIPKEFYEKPTLFKNSKKIIERQKYCKKYLSPIITISGVYNSYTLSPEELNNMISVKNQKISVNETYVKNFVSNTLAPRLNTVGMTRHLYSAGGGTYLVKSGNYGFLIDESAESKALAKILKENKSVTIEPIYSRKGNSSKKGNDIGGTYIEISISKQKLWFIRNYRVILSTPITSGGLRDGFMTPYGVFILNSKTNNAVLKGKNKDGTKYEAKVKYWMPFNREIGMHDAPWRKVFGKKEYINNGSHGCINMPPDMAAKVYPLVYRGMPVIVHR